MEKGQFVAVVGASGCGKTGVISLLERFYQLEKGTLRDNILLGIDPSTITDDQLHAACRDTSIHHFIASLPEGYNTNIASRGVSLSGGQKQPVSVARTLIQVLLLDEATSTLDSKNERLVQAAFERAAKGRTTIAVAHRLATVQNVDVIYVFGDGGHVLERGVMDSSSRKEVSITRWYVSHQ
ncbi:hypothetical protein LCI18_008009 [Fusarium solani-melongenae]|uniref:Uncharacterized protein n=1 Tax=Fusarium solani subsp. cucurbitae TaxID=2747967 RepID=A0ACD3Z714_FUSSC|nr:hypothetical protein LCI18_008009 [Fusarium solani-melongenae]